MNTGIIIREYDISDQRAVISLMRQNTPKYFAAEEEMDLKKYLESEIELYYVVILEDQIVGAGGINFDDNKTIGVISWDIFHPEYQGQSLGKQLVKYRIDKLQTLNSMEEIIVRTSQITYKFYEKQGFEVIEIFKNYWQKDLICII